MTRSIIAPWQASRSDVGSSRTITRGFMARMPAMETRRFWPPERYAGILSLTSSAPTLFSAASAAQRASSALMPMLTGPNITSSITVGANSWSSGFWNTRPTYRQMSRLIAASSSRPITYTFPDVGSSSPFKCSSSVDLPEPLAPQMATISRSCILKHMLCIPVVPSG